MFGSNKDLDLGHFSIGGKSLGDPNKAMTTNDGFDSGPDLYKQKLLAKLLSSQGDDKGTQYVNGWAVQKSPMSGLGGLLGGLGSSYMSSAMGR